MLLTAPYRYALSLVEYYLKLTRSAIELAVQCVGWAVSLYMAAVVWSLLLPLRVTRHLAQLSAHLVVAVVSAVLAVLGRLAPFERSRRGPHGEKALRVLHYKAHTTPI